MQLKYLFFRFRRGIAVLIAAAAIPQVVFAQTFTNSTTGNIVDLQCISRTITVPSALLVADLNVPVSITHTYRGDLDITLTSPLGTAVDLTSDNGAGANNLLVVFDDSAATPIVGDAANHASTQQRRPEAALAAFNGQNAVGTWTLAICDDEALDVGTFNSYSLVFVAQNADLSLTKTNTPGVNGNIDQAVDTVTRGTATSYVVTITNNGPAAANGATVRDPASAGLNCTSVVCGATSGAACPGGAVNATGVVVPVTAFQSGVQLPTLPSGGSATFTLSCAVQ